MLRNLFLILLGISLLTLCYCTSERKIDEAVIKNSIKNSLDRSLQGWDEGNVDKYMELYEQTESLLVIEGNIIKNGWDSVYVSNKKYISTADTLAKITITHMDITVLSKDIALVFLTFVVQPTDYKREIMATLIFRRINSEWKVIHDHTS